MRKSRRKYINIFRNDELELIDVNYTCDTRNLIISEIGLNDILNNRSPDIKRRNLIKAFKYLRDKNVIEFCRTVNDNRSIINIKYDSTYLIHEACRLGEPECVSILLLMSVSCDSFDDNGLMPQHYAVKSKSTLVVDILSLFGISMNVKDKNNNMPIHYAIINNDVEMVHILIKYTTEAITKTIMTHPTLLN